MLHVNQRHFKVATEDVVSADHLSLFISRLVLARVNLNQFLIAKM